METLAVIKFFFSLQGKAPKEIHAILAETLACFLPGRAKDLSAPLQDENIIFCRLLRLVPAVENVGFSGNFVFETFVNLLKS